MTARLDQFTGNPILLPSPNDTKAAAYYKKFLHEHGATKTAQMLRSVYIKYKEQYENPDVPVINEGLMPLVVRLSPLVPLSTLAGDLMNYNTKRRGVSRQRAYQLLIWIHCEFCLFLQEEMTTDEQAEQVINDIDHYVARWFEEYEQYFESASYTRAVTRRIMR